MMNIKMNNLKAGDVIAYKGANLLIKKVYQPNETVVMFRTEPADARAIDTLGMWACRTWSEEPNKFAVVTKRMEA